MEAVEHWAEHLVQMIVQKKSFADFFPNLGIQMESVDHPMRRPWPFTPGWPSLEFRQDGTLHNLFKLYQGRKTLCGRLTIIRTVNVAAVRQSLEESPRHADSWNYARYFKTNHTQSDHKWSKNDPIIKTDCPQVNKSADKTRRKEHEQVGCLIPWTYHPQT